MNGWICKNQSLGDFESSHRAPDRASFREKAEKATAEPGCRQLDSGLHDEAGGKPGMYPPVVDVSLLAPRIPSLPLAAGA